MGENGVKLPPPSFSSAIKVSDSKNIEVMGIDMDENSFTDAYTKNISTWQLFKRGRLEKSMANKVINGLTPEEIAMNMENSIRQLNGFAMLEEERVKVINENLHEHLYKKKILAIIELANVDSLIKLLKEN